MNNRKVILVLGMHRSGTSIITRIFNLLGAAVPQNLMPPTSENPSGYWESVNVARFNNRLLESTGLSWKDEVSISDEWFRNEARIADRTEAKALIEAEFAGANTFVLKCPRLCLLLPFWKEVLTEAGIESFVVLVIRDPLEVAKSLSARANLSGMKRAAVTVTEHSVLLWLRYNLDAERYSRDLPRIIIDYTSVITNWQTAFKQVLDGIIPSFPSGHSVQYNEIDALFNADMRRKKTSQDDLPYDEEICELVKPLQELKRFISLGDVLISNRCDIWSYEFERLRSAYSGLRKNHNISDLKDIWARELLKGLSQLNIAGCMEPLTFSRTPSVLFLTEVPTTNIGQIFRINHVAHSLELQNWNVACLKLEDPQLHEALQRCDLVVVFRSQWNVQFGDIRRICNTLKIPIVYDIDDIIFEPLLMKPEYFVYLDLISKPMQLAWVSKAHNYRKALQNCDAAILTTKPLALAASFHCHTTYILPNTLDTKLLSLANDAMKETKPSLSDGKIRLGFSAGTETHNRNFAVIMPVLTNILSVRHNIVLVIVGKLDMYSFPELLQFSDRIEWRLKVDLVEIFHEFNRFDINLAPLEVSNPFCETKSELRCVFAGAVAVTTVGSSTQPLQQTIVDGETGFLVSNTEQWISALNHLLDNPQEISRMGNNARIHILARFGPELCSSLSRGIYTKILSTSHSSVVK